MLLHFKLPGSTSTACSSNACSVRQLGCTTWTLCGLGSGAISDQQSISYATFNSGKNQSTFNSTLVEKSVASMMAECAPSSGISLRVREPLPATCEARAPGYSRWLAGSWSGKPLQSACMMLVYFTSVLHFDHLHIHLPGVCSPCACC